MRRLSGTDALFLSTETPTWHQHVAGVVIVDPRGAPGFGFEAVRDTIEARLDRIPKYRWKLKEVPFQLDRPVWVDDPDFHVERHVRRIAVPPPGGRREVGELMGQLMGYQLDRRIPLWEFWYVDGVAGGKVALLSKYHHSLMDGVTGASLAEQLFDVAPHPPSEAARVPGWEPVVRPPSDLELLARSVVPALRAPWRAVEYTLGLVRRGAIMASHFRNPGAASMNAPGTPFNGPVGPRRRMAFASVSLDDVRRVKKTLDVKVNDVVLALCAGALRRYLESAEALPDRPLVAAVPISTRVASDAEPTNQVSNMWVSIATEIADPVDRLLAIADSSRSAKEITRAVRARTIQSAGEVAPPLLFNVASRALWAAHLERRSPVAGGNLVVSNVPGPQFPLYTCGARVVSIYSASVLAFNIGLNITVMSYEDRVDFGIVVDPDLVPEPERLADGIPGALAELMAGAGLGEPQPVTDPFAA